MAEIRNYTMNFGVRRFAARAPLRLTCSLQVSERPNKPHRIRSRRVVGPEGDLLRPKVHG